MSFGTAAEDYERYRPGYPDEVYEVIASYAGAPIRTALEIGAGTGKATRLFAAHGVEVTATEPDPAMLTELRRQVPSTVTTRQAALEDLASETSYDLVCAAASLHWTDPATRCRRIAGLLEPGGTFAAIGGPPDLLDPALAHAIERVRSPYMKTDEIALPGMATAEDGMHWPGAELRESGLFEDVREVHVSRPLTMGARDYVGLLSTISSYLQLSVPDRTALLEQILAVLPDPVELRADLIVHLARVSERR